MMFDPHAKKIRNSMPPHEFFILLRSEGRIRAGQTGIILFLAYNINIKAESKNQQKTGRKTEQNGDGG